jgi:HEAT repeat protein
MSFCPLFDSLDLPALTNLFRKPPMQEFLSDYGNDVLYYSELAFQIAARRSAGTHFLSDGLHTWNALQLGGAIAALSKPLCRDAEFRAFLYERLSDKRPLIVMEAIDALRFRRDHKALQEISQLLRHSSPYVRAAVLRYLHCHDSLNVFPILVKALRDRSHIVRSQAADSLDELGKKEAISHLSPLLADSHPHVRQAAGTAIENLRDYD